MYNRHDMQVRMREIHARTIDLREAFRAITDRYEEGRLSRDEELARLQPLLAEMNALTHEVQRLTECVAQRGERNEEAARDAPTV